MLATAAPAIAVAAEWSPVRAENADPIGVLLLASLTTAGQFAPAVSVATPEQDTVAERDDPIGALLLASLSDTGPDRPALPVARERLAQAAPPTTPSTPAPSTPVAAAPTIVAAPVRLNPTNRVLTMVTPLKDRGVYLGDVELHVAPDDSVEVSVQQVFELLKNTLVPGAAEPLRSLAEPGVFAPLQRFTDLGLPITFSPQSLELTIDIPAASRARQSIGIADLDRETYGEFAEPEAFSGYLNLNGSIDYVHKSFGPTGLGDPLVLMDSAFRFKKLVLENEGTYSGSDGEFSRDGTRLVYDDTRRLNRWVAGDIQSQTRGFQGSQDLAGLSVTRTYSLLDPQRNVAPRGGRSFTIDRASTVEAFVNGRSVQTLRLQPGNYDVSDFPFVQGSNDVDLVIVDDAGNRESVSFSLFIDRTQLAPGLSEYGFYAGARSSRAGNSIDYSDDFQASGFYRRGIRENLTLGGNFQIADSGGLYGAEAVWGSPIGTIGGDIAMSDLDGVGTGWAANLSLDRLIQTEGGGTSFVASVETRSRTFGSIGQFAPSNPYSVNATVGLNKSFGDASFAGVQLRYAKGRDGRDDDQSARLTYGRRLTDTTNAILDIDWSGSGFSDGVGFRIAIVRRLGTTGSVRVEYDDLSERARVAYQTSGGRGVGAWSAAGNLDASSDDYAFNGSAAYTANRADLGIAHNTSYSQITNTISDQRTSFRAATSIAFAGSSVAVGRPVNDGFVIVKPYAGRRDVDIEVEPSPEGYYARSGAFGPALYGQVSAYSPRTITFDAPDAPPGFDVGQGALRLLSPYKAGYTVTVGSDYGVTAIGRLIKANGEPLGLLSGVAIEQAPDGRRVEVFTNRQGAFGASGLKAGKWRIEMLGDPPTAYDLIIPDSPDGIARVGELHPAP